MATLPPTALPLGVDLTSSVDGLYWGVIISTILFGITVVQAWIYVNDNTDRWPLRAFVAILVGLDIATTVVNAEILHDYFIANFGNLANLVVITIPIFAEFALTITVVFLVQLFFASRVYLLSKGYIVPAIIIITACISLAIGIYTIVQELKVPLVSDLGSRNIRISIGVNQLFLSICDVTCTIALSWDLAQAERKSHVKKTVTMLQKLVAFIVARGLLITVITITYAIMYIIKPTNLYWMPLHLMQSKIYVISMIAILNTRSWMRSYSENRPSSPLMFSASFGNNATARTATIDHHRVPSDSRAFQLKKFPDSYNGMDTKNGTGIFVSQSVDVV